jgi:hypothetical protein
MRFAILPLYIHRESQFVSAVDDVLIRDRSSLDKQFRAKRRCPRYSGRAHSEPVFIAVVPMESLTSSKAHPQNNFNSLMTQGVAACCPESAGVNPQHRPVEPIESLAAWFTKMVN